MRAPGAQVPLADRDSRRRINTEGCAFHLRSSVHAVGHLPCSGRQ
jgi:hypothetical protein